MAARPWITPAEVKEYTEIKSVQERADNDSGCGLCGRYHGRDNYKCRL
ncbi:MAG: hypothetical protein NC320_09800 [Clostridium sp.]|nr:hypothetical protein [Clostridium sp.]